MAVTFGGKTAGTIWKEKTGQMINDHSGVCDRLYAAPGKEAFVETFMGTVKGARSVGDNAHIRDITYERTNKQTNKQTNKLTN